MPDLFDSYTLKDITLRNRIIASRIPTALLPSLCTMPAPSGAGV
ncbi:Uncharacterised protein [Serratia rubidaea]|nr:Uncharacterised protein [Serratia rubidaea]